MKVTNAFSLNMLGSKLDGCVQFREISVEEAKTLLQQNNIESAIGHDGTAAVLSELLNIAVPMNRIMVTITPGEELLVFQILGRLPEGKVLTADEIKNLKFKFIIAKRLT